MLAFHTMYCMLLSSLALSPYAMRVVYVCGDGVLVVMHRNRSEVINLSKKKVRPALPPAVSFTTGCIHRGRRDVVEICILSNHS